MGQQKEKVKESSIILAQELFSNQCCPLCGTYVAISAMNKVKGEVWLYVSCLSETCGYVGSRELV